VTFVARGLRSTLGNCSRRALPDELADRPLEKDPSIELLMQHRRPPA
jgi:hypothetical protein